MNYRLAINRERRSRRFGLPEVLRDRWRRVVWRTHSKSPDRFPDDVPTNRHRCCSRFLVSSWNACNCSLTVRQPSTINGPASRPFQSVNRIFAWVSPRNGAVGVVTTSIKLLNRATGVWGRHEVTFLSIKVTLVLLHLHRVICHAILRLVQCRWWLHEVLLVTGQLQRFCELLVRGIGATLLQTSRSMKTEHVYQPAPLRF